MKSIKQNFKKNFPTGIMTLLIFGVFIALFGFVLGWLKQAWDGIYHNIPWQIRSKPLEYLVFFVSAFLIIWLVGIVINLERKGRSFASIFDAIFSGIPVIGSIFRSFHQLSKSITGFFKYKMVVYWEIPVIRALGYGIVTNRIKIIKKLAEGLTEEETRLTVYFPTVPAVLTGTLVEPHPQDLWVITNLSISQMFRIIATAGVDKPDTIISEPLLKCYPDCKIETEK